MTIPELQEATPEPKHPKIFITKKQLQLVKRCIIALISLATVVFTFIDVSETVEIYGQKQKLKTSIQKSIDTASLIHNLQKERGLTALFTSLKIWNSKDHVELENVREDTDESILVLKGHNVGLNTTNTSWNVYSFSKILNKFRAKIDRQDEHKVPVIDQLNTYSVWINELITWLPQYTASKNLENYANLVFAYQMITQSKEEVGMERALGGLHFIQGNNFSTASILWYNEKRIRGENTISTAFSFSVEVLITYRSLLKEKNATLWMKQLEAKRQILTIGNISKPSIDNALEWFKLMTLYNDLLLELQLRDGHRIQDHVQNKLQLTINTLVIRSFILCFALAVVPGIIMSLVKVRTAFYNYTLPLFHRVGLAPQARTEYTMLESTGHVENLVNENVSGTGDNFENESNQACG